MNAEQPTRKLARWQSVLCIVLGAVIVFIGVRAFLHAREEAHGFFCTNQLGMLDNAKEQVAIQFGLTNGAPVTEAQVAPLCIHGVMPTCPDGGVYRLNVMGKNPTCSLGKPRSTDYTVNWHRLPVGD